MSNTPTTKNKQANVAVRTTSTAITKKTRRADASKQVEFIDDFSTVSGVGGLVITPPYDLNGLSRIRQESNILPQCIDSYKTNIAMYGFDVVPAIEGQEMDPEEKAVLSDFIMRVNSDESMTTLHSKVVDNYEGYGHAYIEVIRDRKGRVSLMRHARSPLVRLLPKNTEYVRVEYDIARGPRMATVVEMRQFRTFVQQVNAKYVYFKEYGDPRRVSSSDGHFETKENPVSDIDLATELIHIRQLSADPYGVPRWISQLPSMMGSRQSEIVNMNYFDDNTVPPLMITVAGGRLTRQSYNQLTRLIEQEGVGKDRQHRVLIVEAVPDQGGGLDDKGTVSLKIDKLTDARQSDALFAGYDDANQKKVMSSFRLPGVLVGKGDDSTYANSNTAQFIAEMQVFAPERQRYDEIYNTKIVNSPFGLNLKTVMLKSRAPSISNPDAQVKALTALNVMGAVNPRSAVLAANKIVQVGLPPLPEKGEDGYEEWMDRPLSLTIATSKSDGTVDTHVDQSAKSNEVKAIQHPEDGELNRQPEHGQE